jgi:hypothetical protein
MGMNQPITDDVLACVHRDFEPEEVPVVLAQLARYGVAVHESWPEFMRLGVLRLVNGDVAAIERWVDLAKRDYRDVLLPIHMQYGADWVGAFLKG